MEDDKLKRSSPDLRKALDTKICIDANGNPIIVKKQSFLNKLVLKVKEKLYGKRNR